MTARTKAEQLFHDNLGLAAHIAKRMFSQATIRFAYGTIDDVLQAAAIGLHKASRRFDPARGASFTTYAWLAIQREIREFHGMLSIRVPVDAYRDLQLRLHGQPSRYGMAKEKVDATERALYLQCSGLTLLNDHDFTDERSAPWWLEAKDEADKAARLVRHAIMALSKEEQRVVRLRIGLDGQGALSWTEIGRRMGYSGAKARVVYHRGVGELKRIIKLRHGASQWRCD